MRALWQLTSRTVFGLFNGSKMVLVARTDLGMGKGKIAAQCAHAAIDLYEILREQKHPLLTNWKRFGAMKVVLKVDSEEQLMKIYQTARGAGIASTYIRDAGHTQIPKGSTTVCALFGDCDKLDKVTGHLKLM